MEDLNNYITGDTLTAAKFVQPMSELQNVIEDTGQSLSAGDLNQLGKGISDYVANGAFSTDSGAADAYVLTTIGSKQSPTAYTDGMVIDFVAGNDNTGASTVNAYGLGVKNIKLSGGGDPAAGDITGRTKAVYDSGNGWFELTNPKITNDVIGIGQTWQDLSGSRSVASNYTNSTGKPIMIMVTIGAVSGNVDLDLTIAGILVSTQRATASSASPQVTVSAIIPDGVIYRVEVGSGDSIVEWWELTA